MQTIEAIIFDLDDTLYPERAYVFSGFSAVAEAFRDLLGDPVATVARMRELFDPNRRRRVFDSILQERGIDVDHALVNDMIHAYRSHGPTIALHPDADDVLSLLRKGNKLGLITDGHSESQWGKIDSLRLRDRFDKIIVTSELGPDRAKPHPRAFELMAERLGVEHSACVYVADNVAKDFIAPNSLGWTTVRILRPDGIYSDTTPPPGGTPQHEINTLSALPQLLPS